MAQRILLHERRSCSGRHELETTWSMSDVVEQLEVLDIVDAEMKRARDEAEANARNR